MKHLDVRQFAVVASVAAVAMVGGACASGESAAGAEPDNSAEGCELPLGDVDDGDIDGALVVMLDGTVSSAGETNRITDLVGLVDAETTDQAMNVSIGSFGGSDDEVRFSRCFDGSPFVPDGNNDRTRERNRPALIEGLTDEFAALQGGYEASDPTGALRAGVQRLSEVEGTRVLVVHTDGIPTAGCAALPSEVNLSEPGLVEQLTDKCVEEGQLPSADGISVVIGGIGRTTEDLSAESVTFLIELSTSLCEATGASCTVDPNLPPNV